jgi:lipopolysaccharide/colanic/teichoic acid biosynthesis glycosyltransferase
VGDDVTTALVWLLLTVLSGLIGALVAAETSAWSDRLHHWLIRRSAQGLSPADRDRYTEEWSAELAEVPNGPLTRLYWCLSLASRRTEMRRALGGRAVGTTAVGRRVLDVAVAVSMLILLAPLLAVIAVGLRLEGGRGVLCRESHVAGDGRTFELLRFRSLVTRRGERRSPARFHRFVRRSSLHELPQLWNVVRGEMSLVGPVARRSDGGLPPGAPSGGPGRVRAGPTGSAVACPEDSDAARPARDREHAERWSLRRALAVVARAVRQVLTGDAPRC